MQTFINLYLTPLIALSIRHSRSGRTTKTLNMEIIAEYGALTVLIYVICTVIAKFLSSVLYLGTTTDSFRYTLVSTVVAFFLPYAEEIVRKVFSIRCWIRPRKGMETEAAAEDTEE